MNEPSENAGFVAPLITDLAPLFPGYELQGLIATGGMGAVYCAVQKSLDRTVAIKILPSELSQDAAFCQSFEAEAKAMARLNHPNLIGVYDFGEINGMLFIIMEFVAGQSVYHSANGIAIHPDEVIRLITAICDGLAHAHQNGIIHRDIKPSNILLDLNAQPKIGDFGLARPIESKVNAGEEIFGTPHYTAPEVVSAPHTVDHRADIFSLGVMLHELLTGRLPAADPRPASVISRCDHRFDEIILRATKPLPVARYATAAEMAQDLRALGQANASKGSINGPNPQRRAPAQRRAVPVIYRKKKSQNSSLLLLLIVSVAAAGAYFYFIDTPNLTTPTPPTAVIPVEPAPKPTADSTTQNQPEQSQPQTAPQPETEQEPDSPE